MAKKPTPKTAARPAGKKSQRTSARERMAEARAAEVRRERRARVAFRSVLAVIGALAVGGVVWAVSASGGPDETAKASGPLPKPVTYGSATALPPWAAPANASAAATAAGLKVSPMEGTANHFHAHLDVIADGKTVEVPANLGVDQSAQAMSELHTHDASGVVHIEAPAHRRYILGQVFNEWGIQLNARRLGGLKTGDGKTLTAYVDGKQVSGNPASIELTAHREIALVYGDKDASVKVPSSYDFPSGE